jgi:ribonuclease HI
MCEAYIMNYTHNEGESNTRFICAMYLKSPKYRCYHDIIVPSPTLGSQIDHVVTSQFGIFVIESKDMLGRIFGSPLDTRWTYLLGRKKYQFYNPLKQNNSHINALAKYLEMGTEKFFSVIVFWGDCKLETRASANIFKERLFINYIRNKKKILLSKDQLLDIQLSLKMLIDKTTIKQKKSRDEILSNSTQCPLCGGRLIKRTIVKPDSNIYKFLGCSNYPQCDYSREVDVFFEETHSRKNRVENNINSIIKEEEMSELKSITIYTDGSCSGNPGPGGYGIILKYKDSKKEISGGYRKTTNNRMEIMAAIIGLESLKEKCRVKVISDSQYLVKAISEGWAKRWKTNNWQRNKKDKAINIDLWERLLKLCDEHEVEFEWTKGHDNYLENERCDQLANEAARISDLPIDEVYENVSNLNLF